MFLGYSTKSKAYRCYNLRLRKIIESANVKIDERFQIQERTFYYDSDNEVNQVSTCQNQNHKQEQFFEFDNVIQVCNVPNFN